jgi:AcrR family transcriptional regulator
MSPPKPSKIKQPKSAARTPTGRPSRRHATVKSLDTHEAIIASTLRCFHRDGYFRTNMSTVAKDAGITRGCMQYYFPTTEALLETAVTRLVRGLCEAHAASLQHAPDGVERLEYAVDVAFRAAQDKNYQVLVELMAAARTEPALRPILTQAMRQFDQMRVQLSTALFGEEKKASEPAYRAASDLVSLMAAGMAIYIFPDDPKGRADALSTSLKDEVFHLWKLPSPAMQRQNPAPLKKARHPA